GRAGEAEAPRGGESRSQDGARLPKKSGSLLRERDEVKFRFIDAEKGNFPISFMCEQLGVSRSGFYASRSREASSRAKDEAKLIEEVKAVHAESRGTYGGPRVHEALKQRGRATSRKRVAR